jgi:hypothetical protein
MFKTFPLLHYYMHRRFLCRLVDEISLSRSIYFVFRHIIIFSFREISYRESYTKFREYFVTKLNY